MGNSCLRCSRPGTRFRLEPLVPLKRFVLTVTPDSCTDHLYVLCMTLVLPFFVCPFKTWDFNYFYYPRDRQRPGVLFTLDVKSIRTWGSFLLRKGLKTLRVLTSYSVGKRILLVHFYDKKRNGTCLIAREPSEPLEHQNKKFLKNTKNTPFRQKNLRLRKREQRSIEKKRFTKIETQKSDCQYYS